MSDTVGSTLKKARLDRNLTLDQVFQTLRIRQYYLEALENDQRDSLPSLTQGRGFLRLYADYLGLPVKHLLDVWDGKTSLTQPETPAPIVPEPAVSEPAPAPPAITAAETEPVETESEPTPITAAANWPDQSEEETPPAPEKEEPALLSDSTLIFQEIGLQLRKQREIISISLDEVENSIHIRSRFLKDMEAGQFNELPSLVQARGMLNNYALFLGLNAEDLLTRYAEGLIARRVELNPPVPPKRNLFGKSPASTITTRPSSLKRLLTPDLIVLSLAVFFFFIFAVWVAARVLSTSQEQAQATSIPLSEVLLITPSLDVTTLTPLAPKTLNTPVEGAGSAGVQATQSGEQPTIVPTLNDLPLQVYIVASKYVWMKVSTDGKQVFLGRTVPGNAYPFSAKDQIELTSGNAAGLSVFFNQKDLGNLGLTGQVVRLLFTKNGLLTPTPAFTNTPTATPPATATPQPSPTVLTPTVTPFVP